MRKTLTIDEDIAALVALEMRQSGDSFKGTINRLLRRGLTAKNGGAGREPIVVTPLYMGVRAGQNYDDVEALLEELEGPGHK